MPAGTGNFSNAFALDEEDLYIDNSKLTFQLEDYNSTASTLILAESVFANRGDVLGTDCLNLLYRQQQEIADLSNTYKTHVIDGVLPVLRLTQANINLTAQTSGDNLRLGLME